MRDEDPVICVCGGVAVIKKTQVVKWSDIGCVWVECSECGRRGCPAIFTEDAVFFWNKAMKHLREEGNDNGYNTRFQTNNDGALH